MTKNKQKNVILISIDSLRFDSLSTYIKHHKLTSGRKIKPNPSSIDWFADHGIFYDTCITTAPYTTTAHASVLTGQWPMNHGLQVFFRNQIHSTTAFEMLASKGFKTLFFTDFPLILGSHLGFTRGVDFYLTEHENNAIDIINKNRNEKLFCLFHFAGAHYPYGFTKSIREYEKEMINIIEQLYDKYHIDTLRVMSPTYKIRPRNNHEELLYQHYRHILHEMHKMKLWSELLDLYTVGLNKFMKERLDPFIKKLFNLGLSEDSIFIIFGDHGEEYDLESRGHYTSLAEPIIRVPLIISGSGIDEKRQISTLVRLIDILPTFMGWIDQNNLANNADGVSLLVQEHIPTNLKGYTQAWLSNSIDMINYMDYTLKTGKFPANNFECFLYKESLCFDGLRFEKTYSPDKKCVKRQLSEISFLEKRTDRVWKPEIYEKGLLYFR